MYLILLMLLFFFTSAYAQTTNSAQDPYAIASQVNCNPASQIPLTNQQCANLRSQVLLDAQQCIGGGGIVVLLQGQVVECDYPIVTLAPTQLVPYVHDDQYCQLGVVLLTDSL